MAAIIQETHLIVQHKNKILNNWMNKHKKKSKLFRCHRDDIVGQPYRQMLRDQLKLIRWIPAFSRKGEWFEKWRPSWISFHHPTSSHGPLSRVAPILARDLKKVDGMGSIQFAFLFRHSVIGDISCPLINAIFYKSTRTGQKWTIPRYWIWRNGTRHACCYGPME
jgi:hypothetical protein